MRLSPLEAAAGPQRRRIYGYTIQRQTGSHICLVSLRRGSEHHITIPAHKHLRVGTLSAILSDIAVYLEMARDAVADQLFSG